MYFTRGLRNTKQNHVTMSPPSFTLILKVEILGNTQMNDINMAYNVVYFCTTCSYVISYYMNLFMSSSTI